MKILFDLQSLQSSNSANRGIGRYSSSFFSAFVSLAKHHDVHVLLNRGFTNDIQKVYKKIKENIPSKNIHLFTPVGEQSECTDLEQKEILLLNKLIREYYIQQLSVDVVVITSFFDGYQSVYSSSIKNFYNIPTYVILYDLIPVVFESHYFENNRKLAEWYYRKLEDLKRADMLLAISETSVLDGMRYLGLPKEKFLNIKGGSDEKFIIRSYTENENIATRRQYGINEKFLMYTGGLDYRKNIEKLISAYAKLKNETRIIFQLVIVCKISKKDYAQLETIVINLGLKNRIIFTGYITDDELVWFYNNTYLFIFPSLYEGFGLPILEAMLCGAPVITSNTSSMLEIVENDNFTFDPSSITSIADKMEEGLLDNRYRELLISNSIKQSTKYSWKKSAKIFLDLLDNKKISKNKLKLTSDIKKRLAFFSPMPRDGSGIADYSADILPALAKKYKVDVFTKISENTNRDLSQVTIYDYSEFNKVSSNYDRILYHFGNSGYHEYMWKVLKMHPGVVVLHDVFMGGYLKWKAQANNGEETFLNNLFLSHGHSPCLLDKTDNNDRYPEWQLDYPMSRSIIENSCGVIVHSRHAYEIIGKWFPDIIDKVSITKLGRSALLNTNKKVSLMKKFCKEICVFGIVNEKTKCALRIIDAWVESNFVNNNNFQLTFVGHIELSDVENSKIKTILLKKNCKNVFFTGRIGTEEYKKKLMEAYGAIQLRDQSRGESSIAVLDCLAYNIPTIVNNHGSLAEIPNDCVYKVDDVFSRVQIVSAINKVFSDNESSLRQKLRESANKYMQQELSPKKIMEDYAKFIENFYGDNLFQAEKSLYRHVRNCNLSSQLRIVFARCIAKNQKRKEKGIYIDVTELKNLKNKSQSLIQIRTYMQKISRYKKIYLVYRKENLVYMANTFVMEDFLKLSHVNLQDCEVDIHDSWDYLCLSKSEMNAARKNLIGYMCAVRRL